MDLLPEPSDVWLREVVPEKRAGGGREAGSGFGLLSGKRGEEKREEWVGDNKVRPEADGSGGTKEGS